MPDLQTPLKSPARRLTKLPTYVFAELDELKAAARARGADLIDLGMGNPDQPTPRPIIQAMQEAVANPANHGYPAFNGKPAFREAVAGFLKRRYNVDVNPLDEVQPLIGAKEGLAHLAFAYLDTDDWCLVSSPYYPVMSRAPWIAGANVHHMPLTAKNAFLPDFDAIPAEIAAKAKLMFVNYPNNPTGAVADLAFYEKAVAFCRRHGIVLVSDLAYAELAFDGYRSPSVFNAPGAKDVAVEFHSFSKTFNMAGWRLAFAVGNRDVIKALYSMKTNLDYGVVSAIQDGGIHALNHAETFIPPVVATYKERRDLLTAGFQALGWPIEPPRASFYLWLPIPPSFSIASGKVKPGESRSKAWTRHLIDEADVVVTPGVAFGDEGDDYVRVSMVSPKDTLAKALERLKAKGIRYE